MNFRQVEMFAMVMKCGTTSRAAEVLGVTQPAVSRGIAEFERSVGFPLFARIRNRLVATPEARLLYNEVEASFRGVGAIGAAAARIRDVGSGEIRVVSLSACGHSILPKAVAMFRKKYPQTHIAMHVLPSRDVRDLVASGRFDVGLASDMIDTAGVASQSFITSDAFCIMPAGHPLAVKKTVTPQDLHGLPFISFLPEDPFRQKIDAVLAAVGSKPHYVVETAQAPAALALVALGVGVTLASPHLIGNFDRSKLAMKPFKPGIGVRVLLLLPLDRPKSQQVREFINALMKAR